MKDFIIPLRGAVVSTLVLAVVLCAFYPLLIWGLGHSVFGEKANGSLIRDRDGTVRGSSLLSQNFSAPEYFHSRPSSAGANGHDAASSSGSNLGPTSQKLADQIKQRVAAYRVENGLAVDAQVPADAVTASGSGLDPHITPLNAELQTARVAKARNLAVNRVRELVAAHTVKPFAGILGDPGVNVLELNVALDALK